MKAEEAILKYIQQGIYKIDKEYHIWRFKKYSRKDRKYISLENPVRIDRKNRKGLIYINASIGGIKYTCAIARFMWYLINGDVPEGYIVRNIDGNPENNHPENLELIDYKEKMQKTLARRDKRWYFKEMNKKLGGKKRIHQPERGIVK